MSTPGPTALTRVLVAAVTGVVTILATAAFAGSAIGATFNLGVVNTSNASTTLTGATGGPELKVVNTNVSNHAILAQASGGAGIALYGQHTTTAGPGPAVRGDSASTAAGAFSIYGLLSTTTAGSNSAAIRAESKSTGPAGYGLWASQAGSGIGVYSTSATGVGVYGKHTGSSGNGAGVQGDSAAANDAGVIGRNTAGGPGVQAVANNGVAPLMVSNSTKIANLNSDLLDGIDSTGFWKTTGNAGTSPNTNFLGTTDNQPLIFKVNGAQGLRIDPNVTAPNIIGGAAANGNSSGSSAEATVVAGGGAAFLPNQVTDNYGVVSGGFDNTAGDADVNALSADQATVGGGDGNTASAQSATVSGGDNNTASGQRSTVAGGDGNVASALESIVAGGGGGTASGSQSFVAGGFDNTASGARSFAGGARAKATDTESFVWGDSTSSDTMSSGVDSFTVAASGGFNVNTGSSGINLDGRTTIQGNALLTSVVTFGDGDTTPNVKNGNVFKTGSTSSTTITSFTSGNPGQTITILCHDTNTSLADSSPLFLNGTFTCGAIGQTIQLISDDGSKWFELSRSLN